MSNQAQPQGQAYEYDCNWAMVYASDNEETWPPRERSIPAPSNGGSWNDRYLSGLWRYGLMLTTQQAYVLMHDERYPGGRPMTAPRLTDDEPNLWPPETWVIYRD